MQPNANQRSWLGLQLVPGFGIAKLSRLLAYFESAEALWHESDANLLRLDLSRSLLEQFCAGRRQVNLKRELEGLANAGATLVTLDDDAYPQLLRALPDRPPALYVRGDLTVAGEKCLAVVGTRKASKYGWDVAYGLSRELAQHGVAIVSGLAQGIDSAAHRGALDAGAPTIAVVATGIDRVYPRENSDIAEEIVKQGAIISEFPIGAQPLAKNFPQRNRLISGLSLALLVAEAPKKSGALNTVAHANDQGRDVFAVPHNIFSQTGVGCNELIRDGAKIVLEVADILDELHVSHRHVQTSYQAQQIQPANDLEERVFQQLGADPVHIDLIVRMTELPTAAVSSALTMLELKGLAESAGPMQYCRARFPGE